ncbi:hypothetical protein KV697_14925 [Sphingomonas sanguinis]|uniref:hypothetical protein n=1 Tax=Sphingomonas sanguinis TaxID=33051 RepID=UPI001C58B92F|nr:hypothetical protein [Sphingomonas sanguinis]QXT35052.1 hypothetical protein KV697_14925 [Sphingomonas sanguinis]
MADSLQGMTLWPIATLPATIAMAGTALAATSADRKTEASLQITMAHIPPDICTMKVSDQSFTLPKDDTAATAALREARRGWTSASIGSAVDIPYRCTAAVIFVAQQAGFERIGFVALPPPPKPKAVKPR